MFTFRYFDQIISWLWKWKRNMLISRNNSFVFQWEKSVLYLNFLFVSE